MRRNTSRGSAPLNSGPGPAGAPSAIGEGTAFSGPLMTEHLKLNELDLELALLKRKREIMEQQNVLQNNYIIPTPYDLNSYNQQYNEPEMLNRTSNFSQLYDDSPDSHFVRRQGIKRQADNWQNQPPKRFSANQRPQKSGNRPSYGARSSHPGFSGSLMTNQSQNDNVAQDQTFSNKPPPLMGYDFRPQTGPRPRKNFNPTKVTKSTSVPNKLNALPVAARRNHQASDLVNRSPDKYSDIYKSDRQASRSLLGRLELALGIIMKELKQEYGEEEPHIKSFKSPPCQRAMKNVIRERIRAEMLGKPVGYAYEVVNIYRAKYPKETDGEILNFALEAANSKGPIDLAVSQIETDTSEKYFKQNFARLLAAKLDEMFEKLKKVYENDSANQKKMEEEVETTITEDGKNESAPEIKDTDTVIETEESIKESPEPNDTADVEMDNSKADGEKQNDPKAGTEDNAGKLVSDGIAESDENAESTEKAENTEKEAKSDEKTENADREEDAVTPKICEKDSKEEYYSNLTDKLLNQKLPYLLPKYKELIMKILQVDVAFKKTKDKMKTYDKAATIHESKNRRTEPRIPDETNDAEDKPQSYLQYFVKILAKPVLPKKPVMRSFLDQFNPASIKKHRTIPNLLYVGFAEREDLDNILAANKTVFGKYTFDITVSETCKDLEKKSLNDSDVQMTEINNEPIEIADGDVSKIDTELEDQMTDLLSTIKDDQKSESEGNNEEKLEENKQTNAVEKTEEALNGAENEEL